MQKNFAGLFCDKIENIYKEVYNESLPSDWLVQLGSLSTRILIEHLPKQNKSILYYTSLVCAVKAIKLLILFQNIFLLFKADKKKRDDIMNTSLTETCNNLPLMKFVDKTERSVSVINVDSNHTFWILFVHDNINVIYIFNNNVQV